MYNDYCENGWDCPTKINALHCYQNDDWNESDDEVMAMRDIYTEKH